MQVGAKLVGGLAGRETVIMREGMGADFLTGELHDAPDQRSRIVESILPFIRSDAVHVIIGREIVVAVAGLQRR